MFLSVARNVTPVYGSGYVSLSLYDLQNHFPTIKMSFFVAFSGAFRNLGSLGSWTSEHHFSIKDVFAFNIYSLPMRIWRRI